jgi:hypothetical protein
MNADALEILQVAVEQLEKLTKATIKAKPCLASNKYAWDGVMDIKMGTFSRVFKVKVKSQVIPSGLVQWLDAKDAAGILLVSQYISSSARELLMSRGINYLDAAGNCFISDGEGLFWHIDGQSAPAFANEVKHRAFLKNGIKLIAAFLLDENLLKTPYRNMAKVANISLSTVGDILTDLTAAGFLIQINKNERVLYDKARLLERWAAAFKERLQPKLLRGRYRLNSQEWQKLKLQGAAWWGGEPAADLLTHRLQPERFTLYTALDRKSLIKELKLAPDAQHGNLDVYRPFWKAEQTLFVLPALNTVHPLLAYADLLGSGDDRNFETAQLIYGQYFKSILK